MFNKTLLALLLLVGCITSKAQSFPRDFIGHWKGELQWYRTGNDTPRTVAMQLIIQPTDTAGQYTWQIIYGENNSDNRPYLLLPVDSARGHWVVDERNGIRLDQYWVGRKFTSTFTVGQSTILDAYWIEGGQLMAEFYSYTATPVNISGYGTEESPKVQSYATRSYQRARLSRVK